MVFVTVRLFLVLVLFEHVRSSLALCRLGSRLRRWKGGKVETSRSQQCMEALCGEFLHAWAYNTYGDFFTCAKLTISLCLLCSFCTRAWVGAYVARVVRWQGKLIVLVPRNIAIKLTSPAL